MIVGVLCNDLIATKENNTSIGVLSMTNHLIKLSPIFRHANSVQMLVLWRKWKVYQSKKCIEKMSGSSMKD